MRTKKKRIECIISALLSVLVILPIGIIGFAKETPVNKELTAAEIVFIPCLLRYSLHWSSA